MVCAAEAQAMTRPTVRAAILGFWTDGTPKTPGKIIGWLREFRFVSFAERKELFRKSVESLPEDARAYLHEWRKEIWGTVRYDR